MTSSPALVSISKSILSFRCSTAVLPRQFIVRKSFDDFCGFFLDLTASRFRRSCQYLMTTFPDVENLIALPIRFMRICFIRSGSPMSWTGRVSSTRIMSSRPFLDASGTSKSQTSMGDNRKKKKNESRIRGLDIWWTWMSLW